MLLNYNSVGQLVVTAKDGTLSAWASAFESTYWGGAGLITAMIAGAIAINIIDICYKITTLHTAEPRHLMLTSLTEPTAYA